MNRRYRSSAVIDFLEFDEFIDRAIDEEILDAAIDEAIADSFTSSSASNKPMLRRGSRGSPVVELQKLLTKAGFRIQADGIFGSNTDAAVRSFQRSRGLSIDGIVGPNTWTALLGSSRTPISKPFYPTVPSTGRIDLDMKLTKDFSLRELVRSSKANELGLDNTPNLREIENLRTLCRQILQPARDALGPLQINSGFRSESVNKAVGGSPTSDHRLGYAADVGSSPKVRTRQFAEWVADNIPKFDQLILEFGTVENPRWIHVSANPRNRRQILRATKNAAGKTVYTPISI